MLKRALTFTVAVAVAGILVHPPPAAAVVEPVTRWAERQARPVDDLRGVVGDAEIVGLGEAAHGLAETTALKAGTMRRLIERHGFRAIAWEDDWSLGTRVDAYILGGHEDRDALIAQMSPAWRTREVADVLTWLRAYNRGHRDKVRFAGVEYFTTRPLSYEAVAAYVARHAPDRLAQARRHIAPIEPIDDDMRAHYLWYAAQKDKAPFVAHARALHDLVAAVPHRHGDRGHALALHHARQIRSYYEAFARPYEETFAFRDARSAENVRWWHRYSGEKVVYWAAAGHTANAPDLRLTYPGQGEVGFASAGSFLRRWYGDDYRSIGFTFDHGAGLPPPAAEWFEHPLGAVRRDQFLLDLRRSAPGAVHAWLHGPLVTRGDPEAGPASTASGGTVAAWFDVLVHRRVVTAARPL